MFPSPKPSTSRRRTRRLHSKAKLATSSSCHKFLRGRWGHGRYRCQSAHRATCGVATCGSGEGTLSGRGVSGEACVPFFIQTVDYVGIFSAVAPWAARASILTTSGPSRIYNHLRALTEILSCSVTKSMHPTTRDCCENSTDHEHRRVHNQPVGPSRRSGHELQTP
jgi:hypothetical protein